MSVYLTSDWHLGHKGAANFRGIKDLEEHDWTIIANMRATLSKRDKLFILGDVAWNQKSLALLNEVPGIKELIIGNHDTMPTYMYLKYFNKVHGFRAYGDFWLSHTPIHPQEIYRKKGNIHGHIHKGASTPPLPIPYFNVNVDFHNYAPVNMEAIKEAFT